MLSCAAQGPASGGPKDESGPRLLGIQPKSGTKNIPLNQKITLYFDEMVDPVSVPASIQIQGFNDFIVKTRRKRIIIQPRKHWPEEIPVEINVSRRIRDYQQNMMEHSLQYIISRSDIVPSSKIVGKLYNHSAALTEIGLFNWPIKDSIETVKKTEADKHGNFEFLYLNPGKYVLFASEGNVINPGDLIRRKRYGMQTMDFLNIPDDSSVVKAQIFMNDPIHRARISSVDMVNPLFGNVNFTDATTSTVQFEPGQYLPGDTVAIEWKLKNRMEEYAVEPLVFIMPHIIDSTGPKIILYEKEPEYLKVIFSEPIQLSDSTIVEGTLDTVWYNVNYEIETPTSLRIMADSSSMVRFYGDQIRDIFNNSMVDSIKTILIKNESPKDGTAVGRIRGRVIYKPNKIVIIEAREIQSDFVANTKTDNDKFEFSNLPPGNYVIRAYGQDNTLNPDIYFSGMWSPYKPASPFTIYPDTLDVRARWDVEGLIIKFQ